MITQADFNHKSPLDETHFVPGEQPLAPFGYKVAFNKKDPNDFVLVYETTTTSLDTLMANLKLHKRRESLRHKNLQEVIDFSTRGVRLGDNPEVSYHLTSYFKGPETTLADEIRRRQPSEEFFAGEELLALEEDLLEGLAFLQQQQLFHGDVRPELVSFSHDSAVPAKLVDRFLEGLKPAKMQLQHLRAGLPLYVSPKVHAGLVDAGVKVRHNPFKSDAFSLGLTLLEAGLLRSVADVYEQDELNLMRLLEHLEEFSGRYEEFPLLRNSILWMLDVEERTRKDSLKLLRLFEEMHGQFDQAPQETRQQSHEGQQMGTAAGGHQNGYGQVPVQPLPRSEANQGWHSDGATQFSETYGGPERHALERGVLPGASNFKSAQSFQVGAGVGQSSQSLAFGGATPITLNSYVGYDIPSSADVSTRFNPQPSGSAQNEPRSRDLSVPKSTGQPTPGGVTSSVGQGPTVRAGSVRRIDSRDVLPTQLSHFTSYASGPNRPSGYGNQPASGSGQESQATSSVFAASERQTAVHQQHPGPLTVVAREGDFAILSDGSRRPIVQGSSQGSGHDAQKRSSTPEVNLARTSQMTTVTQQSYVSPAPVQFQGRYGELSTSWQMDHPQVSYRLNATINPSQMPGVAQTQPDQQRYQPQQQSEVQGGIRYQGTLGVIQGGQIGSHRQLPEGLRPPVQLPGLPQGSQNSLAQIGGHNGPQPSNFTFAQTVSSGTGHLTPVAQTNLYPPRISGTGPYDHQSRPLTPSQTTITMTQPSLRNLEPSQPPIEPIVRSIEPITRSIDSIPPAMSPLVRPQDTIMHFAGNERGRDNSTEVMSRFKNEVKRMTVVGKSLRGSISASGNLAPNDGASVSDSNYAQAPAGPYNPTSNRVIYSGQVIDESSVVRRYTSPQPAQASYNLLGNQGYVTSPPYQLTQPVVVARRTEVHSVTDNSGIQVRRAPVPINAEPQGQEGGYRVIGRTQASPNAQQ